MIYSKILWLLETLYSTFQNLGAQTDHGEDASYLPGHSSPSSSPSKNKVDSEAFGFLPTEKKER